MLAAIAVAFLVFAGAFVTARFHSPDMVRRSAEVPAIVQESRTGTIDAAPHPEREPAGGVEVIAESADDSDGSPHGVAASESPGAPLAIRVHGSIVLTSDESDIYADVTLVDRDGKQETCGTGKGRVREFAFDGVAAGEYFLEASAAGHRYERRRIVLRPEEADRREDFTLESLSLWILAVHVVTPDGENLDERLRKDGISMAWITVLATVDPPGTTLPKSLLVARQDTSIATVHFGTTVGSTPNRSLEISIDPPIYLSAAMREIVLATRRVDTRVPEIDLVVDPEIVKRSLAGLTFVVVDDATGAPATEASVGLRTTQTGERPIHPDDHGRVSFEGRVPGLYEVQITTPEHAVTTIPADLAPGETTDLGTVRLGRGVLIRGRCVDAAGVVQDALPSVYASDDDSGSPRKPLSFYGSESDPDHGGFTIRYLSAGRYVIAADAKSFSPEDMKTKKRWSFVPTIVDTRKGPVEDLVVVVGEPVPVVLRPTSEAVDGIRYEVRTPGGVRVLRGALRGAKPERVEMAPSEYRLRLSRGSETIREVPFTLGTELLSIEVDP